MSGHKNAVRPYVIAVQKGLRSVEGLAHWLPGVVRLVNQLKAAEIWPEAVFSFSLDVV
jgi:hypothetical protein